MASNFFDQFDGEETTTVVPETAPRSPKERVEAGFHAWWTTNLIEPETALDLQEGARNRVVADWMPAQNASLETIAADAAPTVADETPGLTSRIASDIGGGILEAPGQVVGGVIDAVGEVADLFNTILPAGGLQISDPVTGEFDLEFLNAGEFREQEESGNTVLNAISPDKGDTVTGALVRGVAQFLLPFAAASKGLTAANLLQGAGFKALAARGAVAGAVADFSAFDGHEERLSDLVQQFPALQNPVTEYLAASDEDGEIEGRFKTAVEGLGLGILAEGLVAGVKAIKNSRLLRKAAPDVADDVAPDLAARTEPEVPEPEDAAAVAETIETATPADGPIPAPLETVPDYRPEIETAPDRPAGPFLFDVADLQVDAETFQFKSAGDDEGVTDILRGVTEWDPVAAGQILVWERADGVRFVGDGHQRTGLGRRINAETGEQIRIPGLLFREADGFTADKVTVIAARKNIKEGSGDILDAARIMRTAPEMFDGIGQIGRTSTRRAVDLAKLADEPWRMTVNGVAEPRDAALVGRIIPNSEPDAQVAAIRALARIEPANEREAAILIERVRNSEISKGEGGAQGGLFGDELDQADSAIGEEIKILSDAMAALQRDRRLLNRVAANAEQIERTGSTIEKGAVEATANDAALAARILRSYADTPGPIRDSLKKLAEDLKNGRTTRKQAAASLVEDVRRGTPAADQDGGRSGGTGRDASTERTDPPADEAGKNRSEVDRGDDEPPTGGAGAADDAAGEAPRSSDPDQGDIFSLKTRLQGAPLRGETGRPVRGVLNLGQNIPGQRLADISKSLIEALDITARRGRITMKGALGTFSSKSGVVRLKDSQDFDVLVHEGGHALHMRVENQDAIDGLIAGHRDQVEALAYVGTPPGKEGTEGFAEFFRMYLTNPRYAEKNAPDFFAAFEGWFADNRSELFGQLRDVQKSYQDWLQLPSTVATASDIVTSSRPTVAKRAKEGLKTDRVGRVSLYSVMDSMYTATIDRLHPVNRAVKGLLAIHKRNTGDEIILKATQDPYKALRTAVGAYQAGHIDLTKGVVPYRGLDPEGPSLASAIEMASGKNWYGKWQESDLTDFGAYLTARRSIAEYERYFNGEIPNPPGKLTQGDYRHAVAEFEAMRPEFREAADQVYGYLRNALQKKLDAGLISQSWYDNAIAKQDYVPMMRDMSDRAEEEIAAGLTAGAGGTNRQNVMKAFRGSMRSVINPLESIIQDAYTTAQIIARNDAIKALDKLARAAGPDAGAIAERIPSKELTPFKTDVEEVLKNAARDAGLSATDTTDLIRAADDVLGADASTTLFRPGDAPERGEPILYFWEGGERKAIRLADGRFGRELYQAITQVGKEQADFITNMLAAPSTWLRAGITSSPDFLVANYHRDQIAAFILTPNFVPFYSGARGIAEEVAQTRMARIHSQVGGIMGGASLASLDNTRISKEIASLQQNGYKIRRFTNFKEFFRLTEISETGTRLAIFKTAFERAKKEGLTEYEAAVEAAFQARDYMDFNRHGSKMLMARRLVTFLNAALQGTDKSGRVLFGDLAPLAKSFQGQKLNPQDKARLSNSAAAWTKISLLSVAGMGLTSMYADDPEYQGASEYLRATHWLFKGPDGGWVALPKPFELAVPMNFAERLAEYLQEDDPTWRDKWIGSLSHTLLPPTSAPGLTVPAEMFFNHDTFRGRPIVPQHMKGLEPFQQYNAYTSEFAKATGEAINVSPSMIDHLITGWGGSWARNALSLSDSVVNPNAASKDTTDFAITRRFSKNLSRGNDASKQFWGLIGRDDGRLERANLTYKRLIDTGNDGDAQDYLASRRDDEKVWATLNRHFDVKDKRIHPLRRAKDVTKVLSAVRREVRSDNFKINDERLPVSSNDKKALDDLFSRLSMAEARNAMIVTQVPGWGQREITDTKPYYEQIKMVRPDVGREIDRRFGKSKVVPFAGVRKIWPELQKRLIKDGERATVIDLRATANAERD